MSYSNKEQKPNQLGGPRVTSGFSFSVEAFSFTKKKKGRGQIAVEFFLVAGFVLILAAGLVVLIDGQINSTNSLSRAVIAKTAVEGVANNVKQVWLSGTGSRVNQTFFVPDNTVCFLYNFDSSELYCLVTGRDIVKSDALVGITLKIDPNCAKSGWVKTGIENTGDAIELKCAT